MSVTDPGSTILEGGRIEKSIKTLGKLTINNHLECNSLITFGTLTAKRDVICHGEISTPGKSHFNGNALVDKTLTCKGKCFFDGTLIIGESMTCRGKIIIKGNAQIKQNVKSWGTVETGENLQVLGTFVNHGIFRIQGHFCANELISWNFPVASIFSFLQKRIQSNVQGNVLSIQNIKAKNIIIQGDLISKNVILGNNTHVYGKISYSESLETEKDTICDGGAEKITETQLLGLINQSGKNELNIYFENTGLKTVNDLPGRPF